MKLSKLTRTAATSVVAALFLASPLLAQNNRSWVWVLGSDQNNCSLLAPCRHFQQAVFATAPGGEIDVLGPGEYGPVSINKSITIDGGNAGYIDVPAFFQGVSVQATSSSTVILRNLSIKCVPGASGSAIVWNSLGSLFVEGVSINNVFHGIAASPSSQDLAGRLFVRNVAIRNAANNGIWINASTVRAVLDDVTIENVQDGILVSAGKADVTRAVISQATDAGVNLTANEINLADSSISFSANAVVATAGTVRLAGNNIHDNVTGLNAIGGQIISFGTNRIAGNFGGETPTGAVALK